MPRFLRLLSGPVLALILNTLLLSHQAWGKNEDGSHLQPDNIFPIVKMETNMGDIIVELDRTRAPITVNNFLRYVDKKSYDETIFHRIVENFVVQGGGYNLAFDELPAFTSIFNESGNGLKNQIYTISMARQNAAHSGTRQFFFNLNDNESLDPGRNWGYAVFGTVTAGTEVLDKMGAVETGYDLKWGWPNVPKEQVILKKVTLMPEGYTPPVPEM